MKYIVENENELCDFLLANLKHKSKNNIKSLLSRGLVSVNGKVQKKCNFKLSNKDVVEIIDNYIMSEKYIIPILYEDSYLIVVSKPAGLLSVATEKERTSTLYYIVSSYLKRKNKKAKLFIIHRLDKDTSGIIIFAKNIMVKQKLQANWNENVSRFYKAMVHNKALLEAVLKNKIASNVQGGSYISSFGKQAITCYKLLTFKDGKSLLDISIKTGRKNQIRLQLANVNLPILGDKKYGVKDKYKRLYLHANQIVFKHPVTNKGINIKSDFHIF